MHAIFVSRCFARHLDDLLKNQANRLSSTALAKAIQTGVLHVLSRTVFMSNDSPFAPPFFIAKCEPSGHQVDAWADQPLLDSLEGGGVDWPSSCRNGTCRTCLGQLVSGSVHYEIDWPGLTAEEKAEGYVLPCCAYPDSDLVLKNAP